MVMAAGARLIRGATAGSRTMLSNNCFNHGFSTAADSGAQLRIHLFNVVLRMWKKIAEVVIAFQRQE